jgi:sugar-specific transcriptional regulator TrmB
LEYQSTNWKSRLTLSQEKVLKTLESLGISQPDAQIYIFLGKKGPQKARDIAKSLRVSKQTVYRTIKNLQSRGIVTSTLENPAKFSAAPFDKVLDLFVKAKTDEVHRIEESKTDLLADWQSIALDEADNLSPKFTVIEGRNFIYPKLKQMIEDTRNQLLIISTIPGLIRGDQFGLLDTVFNHANKSRMRLRFITELSPENIRSMKMLLERAPKGLNFEGRAPELSLKLFSRMIIRDDIEAAFFVNQETEKTSKNTDELCLWTNSNAIINSFKTVFEDLWNNSISVQSKIFEMETGQPQPMTSVLADVEAAKKKYNERISTTKKEIIILTSTQGLIDFAENGQLLANWTDKHIDVKIMAPITRNNLRAVRQLGRCFQLKHVPIGYLETTIVDETDIFQFKSSGSKTGQSDFEKTFYSNESDYIRKTKKMLDNIWRNAQPPPATAFESTAITNGNGMDILPENHFSRKMLGSQVVEVKRLTEKEVLSKIIHGKKLKVEEFEKDADRVYSSAGSAIIHPPKFFGLPDLMLEPVHVESASSHGIGEILTVYQPLSFEGKSGYAPVAVLMTNAEAFPGMKLIHVKDHAAHNVNLVREDELQIRTHGNTMFIGWTVPIHLFPFKYILPPACVLIEGYGPVNPVSYVAVTPVTRTKVETNYFNAFVTFYHPRSKYSGPGTDGFFSRDTIITLRFK